MSRKEPVKILPRLFSRERAATYINELPADLERVCPVEPIELDARTIRWDREQLDEWSMIKDREVFEEEMLNVPIEEIGTVYCIGFDHYVKIGFTRNLMARLDMLQTGCPAKLIVYVAFDGSIKDERSLHKSFARHRLEREWFFRSPEIQAWIEAKKREAE